MAKATTQQHDYDVWEVHLSSGEARSSRSLTRLLISRYLGTQQAWVLNHVVDPIAAFRDRLPWAVKVLRGDIDTWDLEEL